MAKIWHPKPGQQIRHYLRKSGAVIFRTVCCDCNLVHLEIIKPRKRYVATYAWRDDEYTKKLRAKKS